MPEYKALAQNTLKIVTDVTLRYNGEIGQPNAATLPRLKCITEDGSIVKYVALIPANVLSKSGATRFSNETRMKQSSSSSAAGMEQAYYEGRVLYTARPARFVEVDGKRYAGFDSAVFSATGSMMYTSSTTGSAVFATNGYFPAAKLRLAIYLASTGTISVEEIDLEKMILGGNTVKPTTSTYKYIYSICAGSIIVGKGESDVILAMEIEYPKYDITFNSAGEEMEYSLDNGATFQPLTQGIALEQVEHIVLRNNGAYDRNIRLLDGTVLATVPSGATFVMVPESDGTWYVELP